MGGCASCAWNLCIHEIGFKQWTITIQYSECVTKAIIQWIHKAETVPIK